MKEISANSSHRTNIESTIEQFYRNIGNCNPESSEWKNRVFDYHFDVYGQLLAAILLTSSQEEQDKRNRNLEGFVNLYSRAIARDLGVTLTPYDEFFTGDSSLNERSRYLRNLYKLYCIVAVNQYSNNRFVDLIPHSFDKEFVDSVDLSNLTYSQFHELYFSDLALVQPVIRDKNSRGGSKNLDVFQDDSDITYYFEQIREFPLLSNSETTCLFQDLEIALLRGQDVSQLKHQLISSNLRLVINIAKNYTVNDLQFMDTVQLGNIGLMRAIDKYKWQLGYSLSTYAVYWIRQSISREIDRNKLISLPSHQLEQRNQWQTKLQQFLSEHGYNFNSFSDAVNIVGRLLYPEFKQQQRIEAVKNFLGYDEHIKSIEFGKLLQIFDNSRGLVSLNEPIGTIEGTTLADIIADGSSTTDIVEQMYVMDKFVAVLRESNLNDRSKHVLWLRIVQEMSLEEVGRMYNITRERARQIQVEAIRALAPRLRRLFEES